MICTTRMSGCLHGGDMPPVLAVTRTLPCLDVLAGQGDGAEEKDDEIGALLRELRDKVRCGGQMVSPYILFYTRFFYVFFRHITYLCFVALKRNVSLVFACFRRVFRYIGYRYAHRRTFPCIPTAAGVLVAGNCLSIRRNKAPNKGWRPGQTA